MSDREKERGAGGMKPFMTVEHHPAQLAWSGARKWLRCACGERWDGYHVKQLAVTGRIANSDPKTRSKVG